MMIHNTNYIKEWG